MTLADAIDGLMRAQDTAALEAALARAGEDAVSAAQAGWPVDTGESLAGWGGSSDGLAAVVENDVPYAEHVHGGSAAEQAEQDVLAAMDELAETIEQISAAALELE